MVDLSTILHAKILIVDDQVVNVRLLEKMLRGAGYTSITATIDPVQVCELYRQNRYDLILLDLQMPGMDGFQVMEGLKAIETESYVPVLVITAQPGHKLRALKTGAKDFISKPFDLVEVTSRIRNLLEVRLLYKQIETDNKILEETVQERTEELRRANTQLTQEIVEHQRAEELLQGAFAENIRLQDRLKAENIYLQQEFARQDNFGEIIGQSNALMKLGIMKLGTLPSFLVNSNSKPARFSRSQLTHQSHDESFHFSSARFCTRQYGDRR